MKSTKSKLKALKTNAGSIKDYVINDILRRDKEEVVVYMKNVVQQGGQSGIISSLIYYTIENLLIELERASEKPRSFFFVLRLGKHK